MTEDFTKKAAMSDMLEIEAAKIAQQKGNADDKKFAELMITDHRRGNAPLVRPSARYRRLCGLHRPRSG
jgi:putative membrane protein